MAQVSTADMDVRLVRPSDIREEVNYAMNRKRPVFIWGPPGIGKSEIVSSITQERSGYMIDMRLALMEPTDLRGIRLFQTWSLDLWNGCRQRIYPLKNSPISLNVLFYS